MAQVNTSGMVMDGDLCVRGPNIHMYVMYLVRINVAQSGRRGGRTDGCGYEGARTAVVAGAAEAKVATVALALAVIAVVATIAPVLVPVTVAVAVLVGAAITLEVAAALEAPRRQRVGPSPTPPDPGL
jgi:hypothetical protein